MDKKYTITLNRPQLESLNMITEIYSRLCLGQMGELRNVRKDGILFSGVSDEIQSRVFPFLSFGQSYGIQSEAIPDAARTSFDLYQVIRHFLAWENEPNTPQTRKWPEQVQVIYDDPMKCGKEPLAKVEVVNG